MAAKAAHGRLPTRLWRRRDVDIANDDLLAGAGFDEVDDLIERSDVVHRDAAKNHWRIWFVVMSNVGFRHGWCRTQRKNALVVVVLACHGGPAGVRVVLAGCDSGEVEEVLAFSAGAAAGDYQQHAREHQ